ncbi:MAG: hypothetical protein ACFB21_16610 [Opitutales bacterium]
MNLANLRYQDVLAEDGGPIERIEGSETEIFGVGFSTAFAWLRPGLVPTTARPPMVIQADGVATHQNPRQARHMAVSACLEHWALRALHAESSGAFGLDIDASSCGIAAFPGLLARAARPFAQAEAQERFLLNAWWSGLIPSKRIESHVQGISAISLQSRAGRTFVVLWRFADQRFFSYGFAGGRTQAHAQWRALTELRRTERIVRKHFDTAATVDVGYCEQLRDTIEQRLVYFGTPEGHESFLERVRTSLGLPLNLVSKSRIAFDGEIRGPWSKYAGVWRVLYEPVDTAYLENRFDVFSW